MRIFVDLGTQKVIQGIGTASEITQVRFKRAPAAGIEVQFVRDGIVQELPIDATGIFGVKPSGQYDADYVTAALAWVKTGIGENTVYSFTLSLINAALDALFFVDGNPDNDEDQLELMCELQWVTGGVTSKTPTLVLLLDNDVVRSGDVPPEMPAVAFAVYLPGITGLVGGTATDLDAIPTVPLQLGYIVELLIDDGFGNLQWFPYVLQEGPAGVGGVEPVDYDAMTNDVHWQGATGPSGAAGRTLLNGTGAPDDVADGVNGDFYIDPAAQLIYGPKAAGAWPVGVSYAGTNGADGNTLLNGAGPPDDVADGVDGDFYIDPTALLIYGPKAAGAWPVGVSYGGGGGGAAINGDPAEDWACDDLDVAGETTLGGDVTVDGAISANEQSIFWHADFRLPALPTADPLNAGALWNDAGAVKISAG